ncbi:hypothetical protein [Arthrobacter bambusae]|uniref:Uncharacterized protein n=1 Tax=Arthrobacter bambusae TaxID=1338426 RepID=A0AAW8DGU3_9MICC|nr:hypothetical protein [Arthrobacter bambusae]MDP9904696.1 hypothetical protein [Arthrobacter bambusae]MDQ0129512.1 hypothetical protein [Arthrobacter bambusae]MDQ0180875.1 hypothetical protein [Arthrobacter bambusae]
MTKSQENTMAFKSILETDEAEAARLAESPEGSTNHVLAQLPVNIRGNVQNLLIELPDLDGDGRKLVVVPTESHRIGTHEYARGEIRKRYQSTWTCIVVASTNPTYQVGCWPISVPEYQLVRGTQRTIDL